MKQPEDLIQLANDLRQKAVAYGALALSVAGLSLSTPATALAEPPAQPEAPRAPNYLPKLSSKPGYKLPLSAATRQNLADATVELAWVDPNNESIFYNLGTAVVGRVNNEVNLSAATHEYNLLTGDKNKDGSHGDGILPIVPGQPKAFDIGMLAKNMGRTLVILDPKIPVNQRRPVAELDNIMVAPNLDWALSTAKEPQLQPTAGSRSLDHILQLNFATIQSQAIGRPKIGQKLALSAVAPAEMGGRMLASGTGRYAGRRTVYEAPVNSMVGLPRHQDVVLTKSSVMCEPTTSGGVFASTTKKRGVSYVSGPLSGVIGESTAKAPNTGLLPSANDEIGRLVIEGELGIDTTGYKICLYTANLPNSVNTLSKGINVRPPNL